MHAARTLVLVVLALVPAACQSTTSNNGVQSNQQNSIVQAEVERRIAELRYLHGNELLQSMTRLVALGDAASDQIRANLRSDDWLTRSSLAWVMGATGDRRYIPDLRGMLGDKLPTVRYEAASALVELGDSTGFATLVDGLSDANIRDRYKCFESLKRATGQDFGYQHDASPESRATAVTRWKSWLSGLGASSL
jgi:HEAT repeat protein